MFPRFYARLVLLICIFDSSECSAAASAAPNFGRNLQQEVPDTSHEHGADGAGVVGGVVNISFTGFNSGKGSVQTRHIQ